MPASITSELKAELRSDLKRAVSTAYYACFHALCRSSADMMVGTGKVVRSQRAWLQAYRSVNQRLAAEMLTKQVTGLDFPPGIIRFSLIFKNLQEKRHEADYDPSSRSGRRTSSP